MLGGLCARWKQIVAFYFTPNSFDGSLLKPIILKIIEQGEAIGLKIHSVTSDIGPVNRAMWKSFGISVNRESTINFIPHPIEENRKLFFLADAPHLLKNLKSSLLSNKIISIPETFRNAYNIEFPIVKSKHLDELLELQENFKFKLIPKLNITDMKNSTFAKMKLNKAKNILSRDVSSALYFLADINSKKEYVSTAWFINIMSKWFTIITSRHPKVALGITENGESIEKYKTSIPF